MESNTIKSDELTFQSYPWLVNCQLNDTFTLFSISKKKDYNYVVSGVQNKIIVACSCGWLVLKDPSLEVYYLFNPISSEKVKLPLFQMEFESDWHNFCVLTSSPKESGCYILFVDNIKKVIWFCQPDDNKFMRHPYEDDMRFLNSPTIFDGKLYLQSEDLVVISFEDRELHITKISIPHEVSHWVYVKSGIIEWYLTGHNDDLFLVEKWYFGYHCKEISGFNIYQLDMKKKIWLKLESIGNRTIFLSSNRRGYCCVARESKVKHNAIYFLEEDDEFLHVFDLEDNSFSISLPCLSNNYDEKELDHVITKLDWMTF